MSLNTSVHVPTVNTENARVEFEAAGAVNADLWVVGCGGNEQPVLRDGRWVLYVWNFARGEHGWLDLSTDVVGSEYV